MLRAALVAAVAAATLSLPATASAGWIKVGEDLEQAGSGIHHSLTVTDVDGNFPLASWVEDLHENSGNNPPRASVGFFNAPSWQEVASPRTAADLRTEHVDIAYVGGFAHAAIAEMPNPFSAPYPTLRVRRLAGSWQTIGGTLNVDQTGNSYLRGGDIVSGPGGQPCVGFYETPPVVGDQDKPGGHAYVKCFNGTAWVLAGGGPLNSTATANASAPVLAMIGDVLHAAWAELDPTEIDNLGGDGGGEIHVRRLVNGVWQAVGTPRRAEAGDFAYRPSLAAAGTTPVLAWQERDDTPESSAGNPSPARFRIFAQRFNGTDWAPFSGSQVLPVSPLDRNATGPKLAVVAGVPHIASTEADNVGANQAVGSVRVRRFDSGGQFWEPLEGGVPIRDPEPAATATSLADIGGVAHVGVVGSNSRLFVKRWELTVRNEGAKPAISGVPQVGQTLTCSEGDWTGDPDTFFYAWERGARGALESDAAAWEPVTNYDSANAYTVQPADDGMKVRCRVNARNEHDIAEAWSAPKRTDSGPPLNTTRPTVEGTAVAETPHVCNPGVWDSEADFTFRWLRGGTVIAGATERTYTPQKLTGGDWRIDALHRLTCEVTATNDVGASGWVGSDERWVVDDVPVSVEFPAVVGDVSQNPLGRELTCLVGKFSDDYAALGFEGYGYQYQWLRDGTPIGGAVAKTYTTAVEDLGRHVACEVTTSNPKGRSVPWRSFGLFVPLPAVAKPGVLKTVAGVNEFVPINMLAVGSEYQDVLNEHIVQQLTAAKDAETQRCRNERPGLSPLPSGQVIRVPLDGAVRCRILVGEPNSILVTRGGVRARCRGEREAFRVTGRSIMPVETLQCLDLGFAIPPVDPLKPPALDFALQSRLAASTPAYVIWDVDDNGRTDAICPGTAPVMRAMLNRGSWNPRAVIVYGDSATTGVFSDARAQLSNPGDAAGLPRGSLRDAQPFICRTSMEQPPDPKTGPCISGGAIGRVSLEGNFCPIHIRTMSQTQVEDIRVNNPELLSVLTKFATDAEEEEAAAEPPPPVLAPRAVDVGALLPPPAVGTRFDPSRSATVAAQTFGNLASSLPSFNDPRAGGGGPSGSDIVLSKVEAARFNMSPADNLRVNSFLRSIPALKQSDAANFAVDQMYISHGGFSINGVDIDPSLPKLPGLVIPTDVKEGLAKAGVPNMKVLMSQARTRLDNLVLSERKRLEAEFKDSANAALGGVLQSDFVEAVKGMKVGPFKIGGKVDVKLNKDQTATVTAKASLPYLETGHSTPLTSDLVFTGDRSGKLALNSLEFKQDRAYFKAIDLRDLFVRYDGSLAIRGEIKFLKGGRIALNQFRLSDQGRLQALDVSFDAPGVGLKVAPGLFLTGLRGGYDDTLSKLIAGASFAAGPRAGKCPAVGLTGTLELSWDPLVKFHSRGDIIVACIPLVNVTLDADETGYVKVVATMNFNEGPLFINGGIAGQFKGETGQYQLELNARGGIRKVPIVGDVTAQVQGVLSNTGLAACAKVNVLWEEVAAGAGVKFIDGVPPVSLAQLAAGLEVFTGCDLGRWRVLPSAVGGTRAVAAQAGGAPFDVAGGPRGSALAFRGVEGAPRVRLRSPTGKVYDFTDAVEGKLIDNEAWGVTVEGEKKTVVLLRKPENGRWTVELGDGSPELARVEQSNVLPKPEVKGTIGGIGSSRILRYDVRRIPGQRVRLIEQANGAHRVLRVVEGGGRGTIRFQTSEAESPRRTIVAEVSQDGLPRENIDVVRFSAPNPTVGTPGGLRVRRSGRRAIVTWRKAPLAARYDVIVRTGDGTGKLLAPTGKRLRVTVPGLSRREGAAVSVVAISARGKRGKAARARLKGTMRLGAAKPRRARRPRG